MRGRGGEMGWVDMDKEGVKGKCGKGSGRSRGRRGRRGR